MKDDKGVESKAALAPGKMIPAAGEPWEGVLVSIGPVKVTNASAGGNKIEVGDNTLPTSVKIHIDDDSFMIPAQTVGNCIQVTGIMSVAIFDDLRTINPRNALDVIPATGCN